MKIVLLTANSPEGEVQHRYVAKCLSDAFGDDLKAIIVASSLPQSKARLARKYWRRYTFPQLISRVSLKVSDRLRNSTAARQETYRSVLFPDGESGLMPRAEIVHVVPSHNGPECVALLEKLRPDIIAVYGTMVIKPNVIALAGRSILNMHTGLSPRYRGSDTIFWPLYNGEPEWVGVTVHRVNPGIDSGAILAVAQPVIAPNDNEDSLFAKCVQVGCEHYTKAIRTEFSGTSQAISQQLAEGREYRSVERTVTAERRVRKKLRGGLLKRNRG